MSSSEGLLRNATRILERVNEEVGGGGGGGAAGAGAGSVTPGDDDRIRPLEDPYLVGEVAAARARRERLARENGDDVLHSEDRRWDWFLGKLLHPPPSLPTLTRRVLGTPEEPRHVRSLELEHVADVLATAQTKDWEERDVSWKQFRRDMQQTTSRGRLARRIGAGR